jgi:hypothetical protein
MPPPRTVAVLLVAALATDAHAEEDAASWLAGPLLGFSWSKSTDAERPTHGGYRSAKGFVGLEAGVGLWMERLNVGISNRAGEVFSYVELDPWLYLGASFGYGYGSETGPHPIIGIWEGVPIPLREGESCSDRATVLTISAGLRWTGAIELYLAPKIGTVPGICIH